MAGSPKRAKSGKKKEKRGCSAKRAAAASPGFAQLENDGSDADEAPAAPPSVLSGAEHARLLLTIDDGLDNRLSRTAPSLPPPCAVLDGGSLVAAAAGPGEVQLWCVASLLKLSPACDETLRGVGDDQPDGELMVGQTLYGRRSGRSATVTIGSARRHNLKTPGANAIVAMDALADGSKLAVGDSRGRVWLWHSGQGGGSWQMAEVLRKPRGDSPDAREGIRRTSSASQRADASANAHSSRVCCVRLSPDGTKLLSGSKDAIRLWSIDAGGRCQLIGSETGSRNDVCFSAAWCADNETLAFSRVHTDAGSRASTVDTLVVTTVSELAASVEQRPNSPRLKPAAAGTTLGRRLLRGHQDAVLCCAFAPDTWAGPERSSGGDGGHSAAAVLLLSGSKDGSVRLWDCESLDCLLVLDGHTDAVTQCRCADEGHAVLTASEDGTLRLWDAASGVCFSRIDIGRGEPVRFADFLDPLGTAALSMSGESEMPRTMHTSRLDRRQRVCTAPAHDAAVRCVAASPNGQQVATGSASGGVKLWDIDQVSSARPTSIGGVEASCRCIAELHTPDSTVTAATTTHLRWSPDGEVVIAANFSGDGDRDPLIRFWRDHDAGGWELVHQQHAAGRGGTSVGPTDMDIASDGTLLSYCGTEGDADYAYIIDLTLLLGDSRGRGDTRALEVIGPCKTSWFASVQSSSFSPTPLSKQHGYLCFFGGLWSVESGKLLAKVSDREGPLNTLNRCCWSADGLSVAYILNSPAGSGFHIRLWTVPHDELSASKPSSIAPMDYTGDLSDDTSTTGFTGTAVVGLSFSPESGCLFCACTSWDKHRRLQLFKTSIDRGAEWICVGDIDTGGLDNRPWFSPLDCDWWSQAFVSVPQTSATFAVGTVGGQLQVYDFSGDSDALRHPEDVLTQVTRGVGSEASLSMLEMCLSERPELVVCANGHRSGMSLLHSAVEEGSAALTSMLLRVYPGASLAAGKSDFGVSVLRIAARSEHADVAELIVNDIVSSIGGIDVADHSGRRSLTQLEADDAIALMHSHPLLFAKLISGLHPVPAPLFVRGSAADAALGGVAKALSVDLVTSSDQLTAPGLWSRYVARLNQEEGGDGLERDVGGEAVVLPMRQPWKLLQPTRSTGVPLLVACGLAPEDGGNGGAGAAGYMFGVGSFAQLLIQQQWEANSSAHGEAAYRHAKLLLCFVVSSLVMVDSIVGAEVGLTLVTHSQSDWEHLGADGVNSTVLADEVDSAGIESYVFWLTLQPYLFSLWAMDMASAVGRASRGHADKLLFASLLLFVANGVFDILLVAFNAYPTGFVIWWDFSLKSLCSLLLVLRSLLFVRGSETMAVMRSTGEAILVATAPAAAVLLALVLGFALSFHVLFSNLDPMHATFLSSLTATVLALGDANNLSSQPFSSSPFALVAVPLLCTFIGITLTIMLTIFGIVVRTVSRGVPGVAVANLAHERAEIIAYELWSDDTDTRLLTMARVLKMPYDAVFDAAVAVVLQVSELVPWAKMLTHKVHSPRGRAADEGWSAGKPKSSPADKRSARGRRAWVHALLGSGEAAAASGVDDFEDPEQLRSQTLSRRLDVEVHERAALTERLEEISAQMVTLIELVGSNERARRYGSHGGERLSPSPAARAHQAFSPARRGADHRHTHAGDRDRRERSSSSRREREPSRDASPGSQASGLRLQRTSPGASREPWTSDEEVDELEDSVEVEETGARSRRRRAQ